MSPQDAADTTSDPTWDAWEQAEEGRRAFVARMDRIIAIDPSNQFQLIKEEVIIHPLEN